MIPTLLTLEAEFWGLEREQPTRARLKRVVRMIYRAMEQHGAAAVFEPLLSEDPNDKDAVALIHKLQTEIGELRTELSQLRRTQDIDAGRMTIIPTCEWVYDSQKIFPWRSGCRNEGFELKPDRICPQCKRNLVVVDVK